VCNAIYFGHLAPAFWRNELPPSFGVEVYTQLKKTKRNKEDVWRKKLGEECCLYCLQILNSFMLFSLDALLSVKQNMI